MRRLAIFIDLDSTLTDTLHAWLRFMNAREGKSYDASRVTSWDKPFELYDDAMAFFRARPYASNLIRPFPTSKKLLAELSAVGDIKIVTDTYPMNRGEKEAWLRKHFPGIPVSFSDGNKERELPRRGVLIDDNIFHVEKAVEKGAYGILYLHNGEYLYSLPTAKHFSYPKFSVARTHGDVVKKVREIAKRREREKNPATEHGRNFFFPETR